MWEVVQTKPTRPSAKLRLSMPTQGNNLLRRRFLSAAFVPSFAVVSLLSFHLHPAHPGSSTCSPASRVKTRARPKQEARRFDLEVPHHNLRDAPRGGALGRVLRGRVVHGHHDAERRAGQLDTLPDRVAVLRAVACAHRPRAAGAGESAESHPGGVREAHGWAGWVNKPGRTVLGRVTRYTSATTVCALLLTL